MVTDDYHVRALRCVTVTQTHSLLRHTNLEISHYLHRQQGCLTRMINANPKDQVVLSKDLSIIGTSKLR